jgi:uncharacterized protein (TIGR02118 family)
VARSLAKERPHVRKLVAFYSRPDDVEAFEKAYWESHVPLVRQVPGLLNLVVNRFSDSPMGPAPYYMIAELHFSDVESFDAAMASSENRAAGKNLMGFARGCVTFAIADEAPESEPLA